MVTLTSLIASFNVCMVTVVTLVAVITGNGGNRKSVAVQCT